MPIVSPSPVTPPRSFAEPLHLSVVRTSKAYFEGFDSPYFLRLFDAVPQIALDAVVEGYCALCDRFTGFTLPSRNTPGSIVNWREEMFCAHCGLNSRIRFTYAALHEIEAPTIASRIYLTEQSTPAFTWLRRAYPNTVGSEFCDDEDMRRRLQTHLDCVWGDSMVALRHEDVTALSFADESLDFVISFDVLEHVPDYRRALAEFCRILSPGGRLFLTVPFSANDETTVVRARIKEDGTLDHLLPPEYHGDPLTEAGCLCFYHFGWDLLEAMRAAGFSDAGMVTGYSIPLGHVEQAILLTGRR